MPNLAEVLGAYSANDAIYPDSEVAAFYKDLMAKVAAYTASRNKDFSNKFQSITIHQNT